ncbi:cysteine-rich CWC family protein [Aromatoleum buckelii]|uniref:Cysteine-rich CWC n=1 Tax=Aromatoleum buckelii TaxID=200254 RepID=A0ABX1N3F4_9RHOO|nr:cysteine-rich CWC family protein [Aromatoleum buckelii]MCK0510772.1 cysteine-rich CWC family protein [Aromatoleum buckelii]
MSDITGNTIANDVATNNCPRCGAAFTCGMEAGLPACWCAALPPVEGIPEVVGIGCYCPNCLKMLLRAAGAQPAGF